MVLDEEGLRRALKGNQNSVRKGQYWMGHQEMKALVRRGSGKGTHSSPLSIPPPDVLLLPPRSIQTEKEAPKGEHLQPDLLTNV